MALIECTECKQQISSTANTCPGCGKSQKQGKSLFRKIFEWTAAIIALLIIMNMIYGMIGAVGKWGANNGANSGTKQAAEQKQLPEVSARQLIAAYDANEVSADATYKGKTIKINGLVNDVKKDLSGSLYVLIGTGADFELTAVQAYFEDEKANQLAQLKKGQRITVVCEVTGLMFNVVGQECVLGGVL